MRPLYIKLLLFTMVVISSVGCQSFRQKMDEGAANLLGFGNPDVDATDPNDMLDPLGARDANRLLLADLAPGQIATTWKLRTSVQRDLALAQEYYDQGQAFYRQGVKQMESQPDAEAHQQTFSQAANQFRLAAASGEDSAVGEDAAYFEGESYFFADRYVQANRAFEKLIAQYPGTKFLDMAENRRFAIAIYWLQLSEQASPVALTDRKRPGAGLAKEARRVLHRIRIDDPTGKLADDATLTLAKAFLHDQRYFEAGDTLEDLRRNYPGSKHQFDAHMLEIEARLASYQGPSYDDAPLRKADEILKSVVKQFPQQSQEHLDYLEQQSKQIQTMLAERDYGIGQYFERRGENLAAKFHYTKVADRFEGTSVADQVEDRIAEIEQKPARPAQAWSLLVNMFPDPEPAKPVIQAGYESPISLNR